MEMVSGRCVFNKKWVLTYPLVVDCDYKRKAVSNMQQNNWHWQYGWNKVEIAFVTSDTCATKSAWKMGKHA